MESNKLKKKFLAKAIIYIILILCMVSASIYLNSVQTEFSEKRDRLTNEISSLKRKIEGLTREAREFSDSVTVWKSVGPEQQKLQGLRINNAKDLLDKWKVKYKLSQMVISFEKPEELKEKEYETDTVTAVGSRVNISFKAITDEYAYNFLDELIKNYPGYVWVRSFSIKYISPIDLAVLQKIAEGETPSLVDVSLDLVWRDLKYKGPIGNGNE